MEEPSSSHLQEEILDIAMVTKRPGSPMLDREPSVKRSGTRRSTGRRSSFFRGRLSNIHAVPVSNYSSDLTKEILPHLAPDERLRRLTVAALEFTHGKVSAEFSDVDGLQQFQIKVADSFRAAMDELSMDGVFRRAVKLNKLPTDPLNIKIAQTRRDCKRMEIEVSRWDTLLAERKQAAENAKRLSAEAQMTPTEEPYVYLPNKSDGPGIDYHNILRRDGKTQLEIELLADELQNGLRGLKAFLNHTNGYLLHHAQQIRTSSFQAVEDFDNPMKIIENLASI